MASVFRQDRHRYDLDELPDTCPYCFKSITAVPKYLHDNKAESTYELFLYCPDSSCKKSFIAYYDLDESNGLSTQLNYLGFTSKGNIKKTEFGKIIQSISKKFVSIYNQAYHAEQEDLTEICGPGYRRALEHLVKDYVVKNNPTEKEKALRTPLGNCIEHHIDNDRIKQVAKRAVWLGNDETHYIKEYTDKDVTHLKDLIELTIHWIEMEEKTSKYIVEMPEKSKSRK